MLAVRFGEYAYLLDSGNQKKKSIYKTKYMTELIAFAIKTHMPGYGGWGNGYVALPKDHPCFEMDYNTISESFDIEVHYGLTYSDYADGYHPDEVKGMWVVGFDTLHGRDNMTRWPNEASVMVEANKLKTQLEEIYKKQYA